MLVCEIGATVVVEVEWHCAREADVEPVGSVPRVRDAGDRVILAHQDFFRAVPIEVDARTGPTDELAALGVGTLLPPVARTGSPGRRIRRGDCIADTHLEVVKIGSRRPTRRVAEPVAVQVRTAQVAHPGRHRYPRVDGGGRPAGPPEAISGRTRRASAGPCGRHRWRRMARRGPRRGIPELTAAPNAPSPRPSRSGA